MDDDRRHGAAHNEQAWFGWIFGSGKTLILPDYPTLDAKGLITMEKQFGVMPFEEENR